MENYSGTVELVASSIFYAKLLLLHVRKDFFVNFCVLDIDNCMMELVPPVCTYGQTRCQPDGT